MQGKIYIENHTASEIEHASSPYTVAKAHGLSLSEQADKPWSISHLD